ncbi:MAG: hypothetical protein ABSH28_02810 [Acidobacteriota bacterium]|jgi:hypothetical protein
MNWLGFRLLAVCRANRAEDRIALDSSGRHLQQSDSAKVRIVTQAVNPRDEDINSCLRVSGSKKL